MGTPYGISAQGLRLSEGAVIYFKVAITHMCVNSHRFSTHHRAVHPCTEGAREKKDSSKGFGSSWSNRVAALGWVEECSSGSRPSVGRAPRAGCRAAGRMTRCGGVLPQPPAPIKMLDTGPGVKRQGGRRPFHRACCSP